VRIRSALQRQFAHEPINVTPLIDVVMCLIIFFLIVGKLAGDEASRVQLPGSSIGSSEKREGAVIVTIAREAGGAVGGVGGGAPIVRVEGTIARDGAQVLSLLRQRVEGAGAAAAGGAVGGVGGRVPIVVRADRELPFAAIEPVLSAAATLGISKIEYATERVSDAPAPESAGSAP
jgi:biopolymer transport protein ExbD